MGCGVVSGKWGVGVGEYRDEMSKWRSWEEGVA